MRDRIVGLLPLAHQAQTQHDDPVWPRITLVVCIAVLAGAVAYLIVAERGDRAVVKSSKGAQRRRAVTARMAQRRRIFGAVLLLALAGAIASGSAATKSHPSDAASGPVNVVGPDPADPYPFEITKATVAGVVEGTVRNKTNDEVFVQCSIDALNAAGQRVLTGTWTAYDRSGNEVESPVYTSWVELAPRTTKALEVDLGPRLDGPITTLTSNCEKRPPID